jgi:transposase
MFYGVDLHSDNLKAAVLGEEENKPRIIRCSFDSESFQMFLNGLTGEDHIAVEVSTNTFWFYDIVVERVKECIVVDPYQFAIISKSMVKTDKRDAIHLARFLKYSVMTGEKLPAVYVPSKEVRELRRLFATHEFLKKQNVMNKNRIHSLLKQSGYKFPKKSLYKKGIREAIFDLPFDETLKMELGLIYDNVERLTEMLKRMKEEIMAKGIIFRKEIGILTSIKGISVYMAIGIMSDVVDVHRFPSVKRFCSYLRSAPKVDSSNQTTRIGRINRQARKLSMNLLIESINHFRLCDKYAQFYDRKKIGKSVGKVRIAMVRKVLTAIYHMLMKEEYFYYTDKRYHHSKLALYEKFLNKITLTA